MTDPDLIRRLRTVGEMVAFTARAYSGWSHRIPASIRSFVRASDAGVVISAGGVEAPHAITFEAPDAAYWKHPVFATGPRKTWHWVKQDPRRFLVPAITDRADASVRVIAGVVDDWAHRQGFE